MAYNSVVANNRLYILDTETGETLFIAKSFGEGWSIRASADEITEWMDLRDSAASYGNTDNSPSKLKFVTENEGQK